MNNCLLPFEKLEREILIKRKSISTGKNYGKNPVERTIEELLDSSIINIDKPKGPTSHQVSAYVQQILGKKKAGHSGTLDPKVTGVLPIAIGNGTRIVQALLPAGKEYVMLMHIHKKVHPEKIKETIMTFIGKIKQLPPVKSAVKRRWRFRKVYYIDIIEIHDQEVLVRVGCQAGTYMRKLATDIGLKLGTGAHMSQLRRTKAGPFSEQDLVTLQDLTDAYHYYKKNKDETELRKLLQPIENAVNHLGKIWVTDSAVDTLCHGANLNMPGIVKLESGTQQDELVAIMTLKNELICLGITQTHSSAMIKETKGVAVLVDKVFMEPGTYPKMVKKELPA